MKDRSNSLTVRALKDYCRNVATELCGCLGIDKKVCILPLVIPFMKSNGLVISVGLKDKRKNIVIINLWPYRASAISSPEMAYFFLHSVIAHELKHVQIIQKWKCGICDFSELFSGWALTQICTGLQPERLIQNYLEFKGASELKKKQYAVSPIELLCYQFGFHEAFEKQADRLKPEEYRLAQTMVESIDFVNRHLEIDYFTSKQAFNRFTHTLINLFRFLKKHPERIEKFPQLLYLFTKEGVLKSPDRIFAERTEETAEITDSILIRLFITMEFDWMATFAANRKLKNHLTVLANEYCVEAIRYLKGMGMGEVFLHQDVLQDNAAMLIKNVNRLNQLMDQYKMQHTSGSVLPLYYFDDFTKHRN